MKRFTSKHVTIFPSYSERGKYLWFVDGVNVRSLAHGYTTSFEQAFRNARNFIKNNQNAVYA